MVQGVEHEVQAGADSLGPRRGTVRRGGAREKAGKVLALREVELEGAGQGLDDVQRGGTSTALSETGVVLGTDTSEAGHLAGISKDRTPQLWNRRPLSRSQSTREPASDSGTSSGLAKRSPRCGPRGRDVVRLTTRQRARQQPARGQGLADPLPRTQRRHREFVAASARLATGHRPAPAPGHAQQPPVTIPDHQPPATSHQPRSPPQTTGHRPPPGTTPAPGRHSRGTATAHRAPTTGFSVARRPRRGGPAPCGRRSPRLPR